MEVHRFLEPLTTRSSNAQHVKLVLELVNTIIVITIIGITIIIIITINIIITIITITIVITIIVDIASQI